MRFSGRCDKSTTRAAHCSICCAPLVQQLPGLLVDDSEVLALRQTLAQVAALSVQERRVVDGAGAWRDVLDFERAAHCRRLAIRATPEACVLCPLVEPPVRMKNAHMGSDAARLSACAYVTVQQQGAATHASQGRCAQHSTHGVWISATVSPSSCGQCFSSESTMAEHSSAEVKWSCCCVPLAS